ncbi:GNAT family N-acetyltransferase [Chitinophaga qingshengii]|uniref:GNAT family N-acetyltransferase n=1 Tax=Chitinophaga qingshengii TaxID=1569794 RepID=A0ABR7TH98_9BACT|nr:GNAT family protein [Chitinophaga qingshengii]MBC9929313.1 GNAT family N-acetyltransferase [Chitinophaga qingshengii]
MQQPVLQSAQLVLRPITEKDTAALFSLFSNEEVTRYMDIDAFSNITEATQIITFFRERWEKQEGMRWAITFKEKDELIGTCGFHHWNKTHHKIELGYDLQPAYWGKGIMTEAIPLALKFVYEELQFNRVEAFVDPVNGASSRLLGRLGFRHEGMLRDAFFEKGQFVDADLYSLLRREYDREINWQ